MSDQRSSDCDQSKRDIPSFIEPRPPLILNPFMRPRPQKGRNLLELFEEDSESEEPELVQVYLRLKPCNVKSNLYEVKSDRCLITAVDTAPMGHGRRTQHHVSKMYTFSHIFKPESNQKEIFEQVVKDNLKKLPEGHNFTLLTYGASGSGKTYTLMGTVQAPGLVPRSLEYVFRVVDAAQQPLYKPVDGDAVKLDYYDQDEEIQFVKRLRQVSAPLRDKYRRMSAQLRKDLTTSTLDLTNRTRYFVWVSFVEIYNEAIYDLLANSDRSKATSKLRIREDSNGQVYVKGATQAFVRTGEEAYDVLVAGKHNLQVAATGVHANSSRSHCIFTITMLTETDEGVRTSCVRLCDLAGCERQRHTRNTGARMQESRAINSSLHVLERCLHMLRRKQKKIDATLVPYRESKLTRLLGAGLSGARGEAVSMVVTLTPAPQFAHETRHVLQLAAVAKDIRECSRLYLVYVSMVVTLTPAPQFAHETRHVLQLAAVAKDIRECSRLYLVYVSMVVTLTPAPQFAHETRHVLQLAAVAKDIRECSRLYLVYVSMVVTLTPAPQFAHETRHVLQLAAVAKDIRECSRLYLVYVSMVVTLTPAPQFAHETRHVLQLAAVAKDIRECSRLYLVYVSMVVTLTPAPQFAHETRHVLQLAAVAKDIRECSRLYLVYVSMVVTLTPAPQFAHETRHVLQLAAVAKDIRECSRLYLVYVSMVVTLTPAPQFAHETRHVLQLAAVAKDIRECSRLYLVYVSMVVTLTPAPQFAHETRHVLQLAAVAKDIRECSRLYLVYVSMVVTLTPAPQFAHETRHVLQLAAVAKDIRECSRLYLVYVSMVVTLTPAPQFAHETRHVLQLAAVAKDIRECSRLYLVYVSMVVTLTPAPQFAHETRHVLQLAAVAKDIQVNQTIQESTFESSTQDSTIEPSGDILRLRSENERLHFELVQAQSRVKELVSAMEQKQQEVASTMFEIVEEAKDMTVQYYETQMQALRQEMEEIQEEYESKLKAVTADSDNKRLSNEAGTPSRSLQSKVTVLMTENAVLQEKLTAEKLARARAEEEVQHLRACIDERDEKAEQDSGQNHEAEMSDDESESEDGEDDQYNESLEPTFKKEDINRSRLLQQSLISDSKHDSVIDVNDEQDTINDEASFIDNIEDHKNKTLKNDDDDVDSYEETVTDPTYVSDESNTTEKFEITHDILMNNSKSDELKDKEIGETETVFNNKKCSDLRGTYVVQDNVTTSKDERNLDTTEVLATVENIRKSIAEMEISIEKNLEKNIEQTFDNMTEKIADVIVNRLFHKKSTVSAHRSDVSLANFEQLEIASKSDTSKQNPVDPLESFSKMKMPKEKRAYFDDDKDLNLVPKQNHKKYFDDIDFKVDANKNLTEIKKLQNEERSPSIVKEDITNNFEPSTIKKLLGESFTRQSDRLSAVNTVSLPKKQASVDIFEGFDSPYIVKTKEVPKCVEEQAFEPVSQNDESKTMTEPIETNTETSGKDMTTHKPISDANRDIFIKPKDVLKLTITKDTLTQPNDTHKPINDENPDIFINPNDVLKHSITKDTHENVSIFDKCIEKKPSLCPKEEEGIVQSTCRSIEKMCLKAQSEHKNEFSNIKVKLERQSLDTQNDVSVSAIKNESSSLINYNNTVDEFDNIYKDITPRDTEFEQLLCKYNSYIDKSNLQVNDNAEKPKYNLRHPKMNTSTDKNDIVVKIEIPDEKEKPNYKKIWSNKISDSVNKSNDDTSNIDTSVDKTNNTVDKQDTTLEKKTNTSDEVLLESDAKCEIKARPKRNLRLRKRKDDEKAEKENIKLKDIVNLQKEFSDVTMDVPAPVKHVKDIESPEKNDDENLPPLGIQSCPSKSVQRSRRKLFTPRAEPLEESMAQSGDSNERIRVPRPSYHRTRARRKL